MRVRGKLIPGEDKAGAKAQRLKQLTEARARNPGGPSEDSRCYSKATATENLTARE